MKMTVRRGTFETNSSSTHSCVIMTKEDYDWWKGGGVFLIKSEEHENGRFGDVTGSYSLLTESQAKDKFGGWYHAYTNGMSDPEREESTFSEALSEEGKAYTFDDYTEDEYLETEVQKNRLPDGTVVVSVCLYGTEY